MTNDNSTTHSVAIAALIVACVSLILTLLIGGFLVVRTNGERTSETALPTYLSAKALADLAQSITKPFNAQDFDGIYELFDPAARAQLSADTLKKQLGALRPAIGQIDAANFVGGQRIPSPGTLPMYQLQYSLNLSGGQYTGGSLSVKVMDRGDHAGIVWFFVGGTTPK